MYARHIAWLNVIPDKGEKPRRELYKKGHPALELIELGDYERWLNELWHEAGTVGQGGMGLTPLSWEEITAWAERFYSHTATEYEQEDDGVFVPATVTYSLLLDWELQVIRQLSQEYVAEYSDNDPMRECPREIDKASVDSLEMSTALGDAMLELFGKKD